MIALNTVAISHWCRNCDAHLSMNQLGPKLPEPSCPAGGVEALNCPLCDSHDIEVLQEVEHA